VASVLLGDIEELLGREVPNWAVRGVE